MSTVMTAFGWSAQNHPAAGFRERVRAAAAAGFDSLGLRPVDLERAHAEGLDRVGARRVLEECGLRTVELQLVNHWAMGGERGAASRIEEESVYDLADALGGEYLIATSQQDSPLDITVERFAALCDRAAARGLRVALEFPPYTGIPSLRMANEIVERAGRPNGGLLVDVWHFFRGGQTVSDLRDVPARRIFAIHLDDAAPEVVGELREDTARRLLPGAGCFPLREFFATLEKMAVAAPVCVEVISEAMTRLTPHEAALQGAHAARAVLESQAKRC